MLTMFANTTTANLYHECMVEVARSYYGEWAEWIILGSTELYKQLTLPIVWSFPDVDLRLVIPFCIFAVMTFIVASTIDSYMSGWRGGEYSILETLAPLDEDLQLRLIRLWIIEWNKDCEAGVRIDMGRYPLKRIELRPVPAWMLGEKSSDFLVDEEKEIGYARLGFYRR
jgi:hypothetical protein